MGTPIETAFVSLLCNFVLPKVGVDLLSLVKGIHGDQIKMLVRYKKY